MVRDNVNWSWQWLHQLLLLLLFFFLITPGDSLILTSGVQQIWTEIQVMLPIHYVTLGMLLPFSVPKLPHTHKQGIYNNDDNDRSYDLLRFSKCHALNQVTIKLHEANTSISLCLPNTLHRNNKIMHTTLLAQCLKHRAQI